MEIHAEYFLKCSEAAKWLNTPQPVTGVPKEFLDGAHAVTNHILSACPRNPPPPPSPLSPEPPHQHPWPQSPGHPRLSIEKKRRPSLTSSSKAARTSAAACLRPPRVDKHACPHDDIPAHDRDVHALSRPFPALTDLANAQVDIIKSLLYVPVELHEHFVFGVALGCPVPPPVGVSSAEWRPLVNRFVLDAGRKCCLMFSYFAEGSIVVSVDCFDEVGDHFSEVTFFEPTPVVGVFPRGIRGRMQIFEKRDCPACTTACVSCSCPVQERIEAIVKARQSRVLVPEHGPAHAGSSYKDENVTIQTYPYWAQVLDEYKWSRLGSYCVQIQYNPAGNRASSSAAMSHPPEPTNLAYSSSFVAEPRASVEKMLRVGLFDKGVSALKPPATDVRWETSSTVAVNANNEIRVESDPANAVCVTDWHKLPGFQEDYLLVAPSNIVSGAHAREELARAEAERLAARARMGVPVLPSWASGRAGVFEHILNESGPELEMFREAVENDEVADQSGDFHARMLRQLPQASVGTVMRPRCSLDSAGKRVGLGEERRRPNVGENYRRVSLESAVDIARRPARGLDLGRRPSSDHARRPAPEVRGMAGLDVARAASGGSSRRRTGLDLQRRGSHDSTVITPRNSDENIRRRDGVRTSVDSNRAATESERKRRSDYVPSPVSVVPL